MRTWMVDPEIMCVNHLIGEYKELFMFTGSVRKGRSIAGFIKNDLVEPSSMDDRYQQLKNEMIARNYKPVAQWQPLDVSKLTPEEYNHKVDRDAQLKELLHRCPHCTERYNKKYVQDIS